MNPTQYLELVLLLAEKTADGKLEWSEYTPDVPMTTLGLHQIFLNSSPSDESPGDVDYRVILYRDGQKIDAFTDVDLRNVTDKGYGIMKGLYRDALAHARGLHRAYDSVLDELKRL